MHLVVNVGGTNVEIQVRTVVQQLWAEMSEKLADKFGMSVKYGGGGTEVRTILDEGSTLVGRIHALELAGAEARLSTEDSGGVARIFNALVDAANVRVDLAKEEFRRVFEDAVHKLE